VVASPSDLIAIDRGGHFRGRYHVLHGLLSPLEGIGPDDIRVAELVRRLAGGVAAGGEGTPPVREVIIATSPSVDGEATAMYVARVLKPLGVKVSRIATGLPVGGELEYSDQATIARALAGRATM
jgi:recombination protein RecR